MLVHVKVVIAVSICPLELRSALLLYLYLIHLHSTHKPHHGLINHYSDVKKQNKKTTNNNHNKDTANNVR